MRVSVTFSGEGAVGAARRLSKLLVERMRVGATVLVPRPEGATLSFDAPSFSFVGWSAASFARGFAAALEE